MPGKTTNPAPTPKSKVSSWTIRGLRRGKVPRSPGKASTSAANSAAIRPATKPETIAITTSAAVRGSISIPSTSTLRPPM